jgi:hypothetical protein
MTAVYAAAIPRRRDIHVTFQTLGSEMTRGSFLRWSSLDQASRPWLVTNVRDSEQRNAVAPDRAFCRLAFTIPIWSSADKVNVISDPD